MNGPGGGMWSPTLCAKYAQRVGHPDPVCTQIPLTLEPLYFISLLHHLHGVVGRDGDLELVIGERGVGDDALDGHYELIFLLRTPHGDLAWVFQAIEVLIRAV